MGDTVTITSFAELHETIQSYKKRTVIYRGVTRADYQLIPKVGRGRSSLKVDDLRKIEERILGLFKEQAIAYLQHIPRNDWEWLALAQHHGLSTRLLDWSQNPLVAAYFSVANAQSKEDSAIYVLILNPRKFPVNAEEDKYPLKGDIIRVFRPPHITPRIIAQAGLFTVHPRPNEALEESDTEKVDKIVIPATYRAELRSILHNYGIHIAALSPGLDGLAAYIDTWYNCE